MQETSKGNTNIYELIHQCKIVQKQKHFFNKHVVINMLSLYKSSMVQRLGYLAFTEAARVRLPVGEGIQFYENYFFAFSTTLQCYAYRLPLSFQDQSLVGYSKAMMV